MGPLPWERMATVEEQETFDKEIDRLAALQEIDCQLKDKEEQVISLASAADGFEADLARQREVLAKLCAERAALEGQRDEADARLDAASNKIRDSRMRLNRVRNTAEMMALQREIDLTKEASQQLEEHLIAVMEQLEALNGRIAAAQAIVESMEADRPNEVGARRARIEALQREVAAERLRRAALVEGMDASLRDKYEQIFQRRGGTAVVAVRHGVCQGCHMNVPPQLFNELQRYRDIRQCPN